MSEPTDSGHSESLLVLEHVFSVSGYSMTVEKFTRSMHKSSNNVSDVKSHSFTVEKGAHTMRTDADSLKSVAIIAYVYIYIYVVDRSTLLTRSYRPLS